MKKLNAADLKDFLEIKYLKYSTTGFIESDPISIPHLFTAKNDREIAGFLTATISWGQRKTILKNSSHIIKLMGNTPADFILNFKRSDLKQFQKFVHRTFNGVDCIYFLESLQHHYKSEGGLQSLFEDSFLKTKDLQQSISLARKNFFSLPHYIRTRKHFPDPVSGSAAKRINMFLRWMVRSDNSGIDFGLWKKIQSADLICPLDVHSGRVARKLGLLKRKQNDWKAAAELTENLKLLDPKDPVKYDLALFGLGVYEKF